MKIMNKKCSKRNTGLLKKDGDMWKGSSVKNRKIGECIVESLG